MTTIFFSVLCSTGILVLFKLLPALKADTSQTILTSYAIAAIAGTVFLPVSFNILHPIWILTAAIEGTAFFCVFHLMAKSAALSGVAFTSVASKMSVLIPIVIGLVFLGDNANVLILAGVVCGLMAVFLSVGDNIRTNSWQWPVYVFLGSGAIDASFKLFQVRGLKAAHFPAFIVCIFTFAFIAGLMAFILKRPARLSPHSLAAGIGLGMLNLGTVYFLMNALAMGSLDSTVVYALNSFGIVLTSMLVAVGLFREPVSYRGYLGIAMALVSITCVYLSHGR